MSNEILSELLKAVLIAAVPLFFSMVTWILTHVKDYLKAHIQNVTLQRITLEAVEVVTAINQAVADPMKKAAKDGKLSEDEKAMLKARAMDALKKRLVGVVLPGLEQRLSDAIEAAVPAAKLLSGNPTSSPASK